MLERADNADRNDGNFELLGDPKRAILKFGYPAVACAFPFRKNNKAGAAVDRVAGQTPHTLQISGTPHVRNRNVAEAFHQPAVNRDFEMRFEFPTAHKLRNSTI